MIPMRGEIAMMTWATLSSVPFFFPYTTFDRFFLPLIHLFLRNLCSSPFSERLFTFSPKLIYILSSLRNISYSLYLLCYFISDNKNIYQVKVIYILLTHKNCISSCATRVFNQFIPSSIEELLKNLT
jgi:hypothetical protein